jgi:N-acetylmuramoyl-L-alanine amidase
LYEDENNIYLSLKKPKDVYNTIVVIDAGHGGKDVGASSKDERYYEKDINLSIMKHLQDLLKKQDIRVYYTRNEDETVFLNPRVNLANEVEADLFLSIHCNSNESTAPSGTEVLYNENQSGEGFLSEEFAQIVLDEIVGLTGKINRGLVPASEMVVVGKANMPVALVETAFMSNTKELQFLTDEKNQIKLAKALSTAINKAIKKLK